MINSSLGNTFKGFRIVNANTHEVEMDFEWYKDPSTAFISIDDKDINNPEFDCDCSLGGSGGLCGHFWLGFIFSLKKGYFKLSQWKLTYLPDNFEEKIKGIEITTTKSGYFQLIDKSSPEFSLQKYIDGDISITEGEVLKYDKKSYEYQGTTTNYYLVTLKNVLVGSEKIPELKIRLSDKIFEANALTIGDTLETKGKLVKDKFQGVLVKFI